MGLCYAQQDHGLVEVVPPILILIVTVVLCFTLAILPQVRSDSLHKSPHVFGSSQRSMLR